MQMVIFEYRLREDADRDAYAALSQSMYGIVQADPGFGFVAMEAIDRPDGSRVVLEEFRDERGMRAWAANPAHQEAQRRGREEFYEWYRVRTGTIDRDWSYAPPPARAAAG